MTAPVAGSKSKPCPLNPETIAACYNWFCAATFGANVSVCILPDNIPISCGVNNDKAASIDGDDSCCVVCVPLVCCGGGDLDPIIL